MRGRQRLRRIVGGVCGFLFLLLIYLLTGRGEEFSLLERFVLKSGNIIVERRPDPNYEHLFAHYVELCSLSPWSRIDGSARGNPFGHAVMYIKGTCKDETAPFPQLRRCRGTATSVNDPEHGVGVSVGQWFRNVNWIAVPGYNLFYTGNLKSGERLSQSHLDATVQEAVDRGVFNGVDLHEGWMTTDDASIQAYISRWSIGTDFALQFSRNVFCSRVPVTEPMIDEIIAFLNDKNREYATGKADYNWNLFSNNCVHTLRNVLAAVNLWSPMSVRQVKVRHFFNLAVPANEFVNLATLGAEGPLADFHEIQDYGPSRDALHDFRWLPTRHGALVKAMPVHQPNDIYTTTFRLFAVQSPFRMSKSADAVRLLSDAKFVDLPTNLRYFRDTYDTILAKHDYRTDPLASVRGTPYRRVERLHFAYLQAQRDDVDVLLQRLAERSGAQGEGTDGTDARETVR